MIDNGVDCIFFGVDGDDALVGEWYFFDFISR